VRKQHETGENYVVRSFVVFSFKVFFSWWWSVKDSEMAGACMREEKYLRVLET
jgi:hypothetical protein